MIVQLLTLGEFLLTPGEAVVYYVSPTEPPNSNCPGQPCHTLENYSCQGESYFSSEKVNVTLILMQGNHTLKNCGIDIKHLETCKIMGVGSACEVIVHTFQDIWFFGTINIYIENLALIGGELFYSGIPKLFFANDFNQILKDPYYRRMFITISGTKMKGISIHTTFNVLNFFFFFVLANSTITNGSKLQLYSPLELKSAKKYGI